MSELQLDARDGDVCLMMMNENEDALAGKKIMKTISNAASFLYKFNIEPKNPDGTKIGSERDDENVSRERRATVDEPCPKCDNHVLRFYTMQLRSADEGQTVFYDMREVQTHFYPRTIDSFINDDDGQRRRKTTTTHSVASERFLEREESSFERDNFRAVVSVGEEVYLYRVLSVFPSTGFSDRDVDVQSLSLRALDIYIYSAISKTIVDDDLSLIVGHPRTGTIFAQSFIL